MYYAKPDGRVARASSFIGVIFDENCLRGVNTALIHKKPFLENQSDGLNKSP